MLLHVEASDLTTIEFGAALDALDITQRHAARLFSVSPRHIRRWRSGNRRVPPAVSIVIRLLVAGMATVDQIEQVAVPVPARTNGGAKPELPAPLVESAPVQAVTLAEKVLALGPGTCHWPHGDPQNPDFHFCGDPVVEPPYCERHHAAAYVAPRAGARFVAHGYQPRPPAAGTLRQGRQCEDARRADRRSDRNFAAGRSLAIESMRSERASA